MKQIRKRFTYANVMSSIAVFLVLGGATAFAAAQLGKNTVGTKQLKKDAVVSSKVKNGSLKASDFASGQLPAGPVGPQGPQGPTGPAGSAVAYAHVEGDGTVDLENSKNIVQVNVQSPSAGVYCFLNLSFTPHVVATSPDAFGPVDGILVNPSNGPAGCPTGTQLRVRTTTAAAPSTPSAHPFYIIFE